MCFMISDSINKKEIKEIVIFTGESAYNGEKINYALRNDIPLTEFQQKRLEIVEKAIEKSKIIEDRELYRVIGAKNQYRFKIGQIVVDNGIMEASLNKKIIETFPNKKYLLLINVPKDTTCLPVECYNHRKEYGVLFPRHTKLLITKKAKKGKIHEIYCTLIR